MSRLNKTWTADEIDYLISAWGNVNMSTITKHLDRSECAIRLKAGKLNLGPFLANGYRYITISNLYKLIRPNTSATYLKTSWVKNRNLPTHNISRSSKTNFIVVYIDEFWMWAEKNQYFLDFSKLEKYQLGPEPENLDKVRAYIGDGEFGDNIPNRPLKYKRLMTDEDKDEMNVLLSALAGLINCIAIANSDVGEEYSEFWQKDMCLNWDDVKGCLACKNNCDSCTLFRRIPAQYCKRCGKDFFERKQNIFCSACRTARLHQAQKKYAILHQKQSRK